MFHELIQCVLVKLFLFILIILLSVSMQVLGQHEIDTAKIQRKSRHVRRKFTKTPTVLAQKLTAEYQDPSIKVIAMTYWIAKNIKYDYKAFINRSAYGKNSKKVLKKKRALCGEYAELFNEMCSSVGIDSETVGGYTKDYDFSIVDTLYRAEHAWTATKINGEWVLMDITWGSGYIKPKKQYLARLLWFLISKPYDVKSKFKKHYNPDWFYVHPTRMIQSHFPILDIFQLQNKPTTIDEFIKGEISFSPNVNRSSVGLNDFSSKSNYDKWVYSAENGNLNNLQNNRVLGFNYLLISDSLFRKYKNPKDRTLLVNEYGLNSLSRYYSLADSLLSLSLEDNNREYDTYSNRNKLWKNRLKTNNKLFVKQIKGQIKKDLKQISLFLKMKQKIKSERRRNKRTIKTISKKQITKVKRPKKESIFKQQKVKEMFSALDSLNLVLDSMILTKDSLFNVYSKSDRDKILLSEGYNLVVNKKVRVNLKGLVKSKKGASFQGVYRYNDSLNKPWLRSDLEGVSIRNRTNTDTLVRVLLKDFYKIKGELKAYSKGAKNRLRIIQKIKKSSFKDLKEDSIFDRVQKESNNRLALYDIQQSEFNYKYKKYIKFLKKNNKKLAKSNRELIKESMLENYRYNTYNRYRSRIRKAENNRIKQFRKELKTIKGYIENTKELN